MTMRYGRERSDNFDFEFDRQIIERYGSRVPSRVFDAHFHLSPTEIPNTEPDQIFNKWREYTNEYLGGDKIRGGLVMANPVLYISDLEKTEVRLNLEREFTAEIAENNDGFANGLVLRPTDTPEIAEKWIAKYKKITVLKPYRCYAKAEDTFEADITTYAPEWMWEIAHHYGMCIILHLSHYRDGLSHPGNGEELRYLCKKYPNAKVNLAHCAMGHNPEKLKWGLHYLDGLDNVYADMGGIGEALSMIYLIKTLGTDKLMFASDGYQFAFNQGTRCFAIGGGFLGLSNKWMENINLPPDYAFNIIPPALENLLAMFAAGDICELSQSQWEDIFYNNAAKLYLTPVRE